VGALQVKEEKAEKEESLKRTGYLGTNGGKEGFNLDNGMSERP